MDGGPRSLRHADLRKGSCRANVKRTSIRDVQRTPSRLGTHCCCPGTRERFESNAAPVSIFGISFFTHDISDFECRHNDVNYSRKLWEAEKQRRCDVDRKSTRLNSSHANISHAVFCLKKKQVQLRILVPVGRACERELVQQASLGLAGLDFVLLARELFFFFHAHTPTPYPLSPFRGTVPF